MELFNTHKQEKKEVQPASNLFGGLTRSPTEQTIEDILKKSTFIVHQGAYVCAKARSRPERGRHFMVSEDESEITVVTKEENLKYLDLLERNKESYALIGLNPAAPFYSVGFLAAVSGALAKQKHNLLIVSTYSKDYILLNVKQLESGVSTLESLGIRQLK